jgi:aspartyl-tRNA(Asn)/glutamyl-tRNA(Gln) amidotransferase subunit A
MVRNREVSTIEVAEAYLARIERFEPRLRAFITVTADRALEAAREAEAEISRNEYRGLLHGIPLAHKDVLCTRGVPTTAGSKLLADFVPDYDATVIARLHEAGATLIGKTSTPEFTDGIDEKLGLPYWPNPWDLDRTSGGSSAGSGAAVSAALCAAATGTDTGGSVRQPAAFCGVFALKPTYGLVSRAGMFPLSWSLDGVGLMARSVSDVALLLQAVAGYDEADPTSADVSIPHYHGSLDGSVKGIRLGIPQDHFFDRIDPGVENSVRRAVEVLEGLGAHTVEVSLPSLRDASAAEAAEMTIMSAEAASYQEPTMRTSQHEYTQGFRNFLHAGEQVLAIDYLYAQRVRQLIINDFESAFEKVDLLISPTVPMPAPRQDQKTVVIQGVEEGVIGAMWRLTYASNLTGYPSLSAPCGFVDGLPVAMQLTGRPFTEETILRVARAHERAAVLDLRPPIERLITEGVGT